MFKYFVIYIFVLLSFNILMGQAIPNLPIPLGAGTAEVWHNEIYYLGGSNNWSGSIVYPRIYKYDGITWAYHDSIPDNNLWDVESVMVGDSVYLVGGWPSGAPLLRKYDMNTGNWDYLTSSPNTQTWGVTAEHFNNRIYLFNSTGAAYEYDISTDNWSINTSNTIAASWDLSSILYNDEIYIIGYYDSSFFKYSPSTDQWTELAKSPYHVGACAMGIINDSIYCVGGNAGGNVNVAQYRSTIAYSISNNTWNVDSLRLSGKRHWMSTAEYGGGLYVLGGIDSLALSVFTVEEIVPQGTSNIINRNIISDKYILKQNYPNPFNPTTTIEFSIPISDFITINIINLKGQVIAKLISSMHNAGNHKYEWDATNNASGIYFYTIETSYFSKSRKMILLK